MTFLGCASAPYVPPTILPPQQGVAGVYHRVEKGETLWRISKAYNVDLDEIARVNRIADTTTIEQGQLILIPKAQVRQTIPVTGGADDFMWPLRGRVMCAFGATSNNMVNKGVNIRPLSSADVVASRSGKVVFYSDNFGSFGKTIIIDHGDGLSSVYARNADVFVKAGDSVAKGTVIAKVGSAGRDKTTYLHFEIRKAHIPQNPGYYLP